MLLSVHTCMCDISHICRMLLICDLLISINESHLALIHYLHRFKICPVQRVAVCLQTWNTSWNKTSGRIHIGSKFCFSGCRFKKKYPFRWKLKKGKYGCRYLEFLRFCLHGNIQSCFLRGHRRCGKEMWTYVVTKLTSFSVLGGLCQQEVRIEERGELRRMGKGKKIALADGEVSRGAEIYYWAWRRGEPWNPGGKGRWNRLKAVAVIRRQTFRFPPPEQELIYCPAPSEEPLHGCLHPSSV